MKQLACIVSDSTFILKVPCIVSRYYFKISLPSLVSNDCAPDLHCTLLNDDSQIMRSTYSALHTFFRFAS